GNPGAVAHGATGRIVGAARGRANVVPTRTKCVETTGDLMPPADAGNPARRPAGGFAQARSASPGGRPPAVPREERNQGLYDSQFEHDACGVGLVADLSGRRAHHTVAQALTVLRNLDHRGAKGSDPGTGDGAGILTQMPDALFRATCEFELPAMGSYAA